MASGVIYDGKRFSFTCILLKFLAEMISFSRFGDVVKIVNACFFTKQNPKFHD